MNMVSGLRHGVLLTDADVLVWRQVWPERGRTHEPVDARRLHSTNHIAEVTYIHLRVIKKQAPACAKTRSSEMRALREEETLAR
jgi:hypothetical protein